MSVDSRDVVELDGHCVEIRRSARRRRTISARVEADRVIVMVPARLSAGEERKAVEDLVQRVLRKQRSSRNDDVLMARGHELSRQYLPGAPQASSIRWVSNMTTRWGSCSTGDASIRLSDVLCEMPQYVIDSVLLHELAHLLEAGHGRRFQELVRVHPDHERAEAYLAGASFAARRQGIPAQASIDED